MTFPDGAGNDFQAKSVIFDLTFGEITGSSLVINEVYYKVDSAHGLDSPKDRGISVNGNNVTITISGNGAGSKNTVTVSQSRACKILQSNATAITNSINSSSSTGGNSANGNSSGVVKIISGAASSVVNIINGGSSNSASGCGNMLGQNDEWVELYNPTGQDISLKDWTLTDNSGQTSITHANKIVKAGSFAVLAKSASTFNKWSIPSGALKVELGNQIGDGLDNAGDHLVLKNNLGVEVDRMSWGTDTSGFTPPAVNPVVPLGSSTERLVPGLDTDTVSDWHVQTPPDPGS